MKRMNFEGRKDLRRKKAVERQKTYEKLTVRGKVMKLNKHLGKGIGAERERKRIKEEE